MFTLRHIFYAMILVFCLPLTVVADEKEELTVIRNTVVNLLQELVNQGVMTQEQAAALVQNAQQKAAQEVAIAEQKRKSLEAEEKDQNAVRVQYVPEFVKEEIRNQVRQELKQEVINDVIAHAETNRWGIKDALPEWTSRIKFFGDLRVRGQGDIYPSGNDVDGTGRGPLDIQAVNSAGGLDLNDDDQFLNATKDRFRQRIRLRLGAEAKLSESFKAGFRLATGNQNDPVSTNQTVDTSDGGYNFNVDRAYIAFNQKDDDGYQWLDARVGRFANPWFSTDLVWDDDLNFDGVSMTYRKSLASRYTTSALGKEERQVYFTAGAFALQEFDFRSGDKWFWGAQAGADWTFRNQTQFNVGLAYYDFENINGKFNTDADPDEFDNTIPEYVQKGNTVFDINNLLAAPRPGLAALASEFELLNLTSSVSFYQFAPYRLMITADYVENLGFDDDDILEIVSLAGGVLSSSDIGSTGYSLRFDFGWPEIKLQHQWNVSLLYKHLETDAVLDAFTDSDFRLGGTNAEGWVIGANYGLSRNVWASFRWLSADEIDQQAFGVDSIQLDLNSRF